MKETKTYTYVHMGIWYTSFCTQPSHTNSYFGILYTSNKFQIEISVWRLRTEASDTHTC